MKFTFFGKENRSKTQSTIEIILDIIVISLLLWYFLNNNFGIGQERVNLDVVVDCDGNIINYDDLPRDYNYSEVQNSIYVSMNKGDFLS